MTSNQSLKVEMKICGKCKIEDTPDKFIKFHNRCKKCSLNMLSKYNYKTNKEFREKIKAKQRLKHSKMSIEDKKIKSKRCAMLNKKRKIQRILTKHLINKLMLHDIIKSI